MSVVGRPGALGSLGIVAALMLALPGAPLRAQDPATRDLASIVWVRVPAGTFDRGCVERDIACRPAEHPRRVITLTTPFDLMATEVTVGQYRTYAEAAGVRPPRQPFWNEEHDRPMVNLTWFELRDFCAWIGGRLPTEAEWERAARGGRDRRPFAWDGPFEPHRVNASGYGEDDPWPWTAPVGSYPPNAFGLYDMSGNVWEWVADWFWRRFYEVGPDTDPVWLDGGRERVLRGGSWDSTPTALRLSFRYRLPPGGRYGLFVGGRCARDVRRD